MTPHEDKDHDYDDGDDDDHDDDDDDHDDCKCGATSGLGRTCLKPPTSSQRLGHERRLAAFALGSAPGRSILQRSSRRFLQKIKE